MHAPDRRSGHGWSSRARSPWAPLALLALALALAGSASAQNRVLGYQDCQKCHKPAVNKWRLEEPRSPKAHADTHKQLADPKAAGYARAIGLADPAQPGGRCAACHATVVRGLVRGGVSCESCHGAASAWLTVHDKEPFAQTYKQSLPLGLRDLHQKPAEIAGLCVGCHVTPDKALADAGHPNGAQFDPGAGLKKLVHWTAEFTPDGSVHATYDYAQVSAAGRPLVQKALAGGPRTSPPGAGKATPAPAKTAATGPAAAPPRSAAAQAPLSLFDESVVALQCPPDCPTDGPEAAPGPVPGPDVGAPRATPPPRAVQRSIVVDTPSLETPALEPPPVKTPSLLASRSRASLAAALRGRAAELLTRLLQSGKRAPGLAPPAAPVEFQGPDSELLNVQDLTLQLALETLRKQP